MNRKPEIIVRINISQLEALKKLKEVTRVPMAVVIREGIDIVLQRYGMKKKEDVNASIP